MATLSDLDWQIRLAAYQFFIDHARPPAAAEIADAFSIDEIEARASYQRLHDGHAFVLAPGTSDIRMANPLSGVATSFRVAVGGRRLYANCAWDSVGIPAMLHADAEVEAGYTNADGRPDPARYAIVADELRGDDGLVHFPLPFRRWYDDLVHT